MIQLIRKSRKFACGLLVVALLTSAIPLNIALAATTVKLDKTKTTIVVGGSIKLVATVKPSAAIVWKSSKTSVATVDKKGNVKGIKAGTAVITASVGEIAAKCAVTVKAASGMKVLSTGIKNGYIGNDYGSKGSVKKSGIPVVSIPLSITGAPAGTKSYAVEIIDPEGGNWVHWIATNIKSASIIKDASRKWAGKIKQGYNDFGMLGYGGPTPPKGTHTYYINVYALKNDLPLANKFTHKQFKTALKGIYLKKVTIKGKYSK